MQLIETGQMVMVKFHRLPHAGDLPLPGYATSGAAGMDIRAAHSAVIWPGDPVTPIQTGFRIELPPNIEAQVRPRSGLASKGIAIANAPGTIDPDYRGELIVLLINHSASLFQINRGDRIAQLVFAPVLHLQPIEVESLSETERGERGFGSTGT